MEMDEVNSVGGMYTWANNREGEGFVEEKLDKLFGASTWLLKHPRAKLIHEEKQTSDHKLLILDSDPEVNKGSFLQQLNKIIIIKQKIYKCPRIKEQ